MHLRPQGAELFHANGWTDTTKLAVAFRNFLNGSKNGGKKTREQFRSVLYYRGNLQCYTKTDTILVSSYSYALAGVFRTI